jgi:DNA polymerase III alpha subunit (gram-positive type)
MHFRHFMVDVETTGLRPDRNAMIQLAVPLLGRGYPALVGAAAARGL